MANILIVDDSRTSRKILRGLLEANGYVVVGEAKNGQEGYDMYSQYKPDLVTMDITMPVMSGVDSLKKIKADFPDAKVVMVSAAGQQHNMLEAVQSGAAEFIAKPFDLNVLLAKIQALLRRSYDFAPTSNVLAHRGALRIYDHLYCLNQVNGVVINDRDSCIRRSDGGRRTEGEEKSSGTGFSYGRRKENLYRIRIVRG